MSHAFAASARQVIQRIIANGQFKTLNCPNELGDDTGRTQGDRGNRGSS